MAAIEISAVASKEDKIAALEYFLKYPSAGNTKMDGTNNTTKITGDSTVKNPGIEILGNIRGELLLAGQIEGLWGGMKRFVNADLVAEVITRAFKGGESVSQSINTLEGARKMGLTKEQLMDKRKADAVLDPKFFIQEKLKDRANNQATAMKTYEDQYKKYYNVYGYSKEEAHDKAKKAAEAVNKYLEEQHSKEFPEVSFKEAKDRITQNVGGA